jgi:hypothetical protein
LKNLVHFQRRLGKDNVVPISRQGCYSVRKITFDKHTYVDGHVAPDPMLLAFRAAINWSRRQGQTRLADGVPVDLTYEGKDKWDNYLNNLAIKEYLEWRKETQAAHRKKEILGMTFDVRTDINI